MNTKHKWYDVIVAWANGETIQVKSTEYPDEFTDFIDDLYPPPDFNSNSWEWRVKPKTITKKCRMALVSASKFNAAKNVIAVDIANTSIDDPIEYNVLGFIRWVGEPVEVEIDV